MIAEPALPVKPAFSASRAEVFSDVRLRVDGQRPVRLAASQLLHVVVDDGTACGVDGAEADQDILTLYLTQDGDCVAHIVHAPCRARPRYRSAPVASGDEVAKLVHRVCTDPAAQPAMSDAARAKEHASGKVQAAAVLPRQVMDRLGPFLKQDL